MGAVTVVIDDVTRFTAIDHTHHHPRGEGRDGRPKSSSKQTADVAIRVETGESAPGLQEARLW